MNLRSAVLTCFFCSLSLGLQAADEKKKQAAPTSEKAPEASSDHKTKAPVQTQHTFSGPDGEFAYTATTGTITLKKDEREPQATIFYTAYTKGASPTNADGAASSSEDESQDESQLAPSDPSRPLVFCFNGGPGSSSVWLHLGGFGPKRVDMPEDGTQSAPPFHLTDNPHSILAVADLVFIDPVSTGFSRAIEPKEAKAFHSLQGDIDSVADFIRLYTTRNERWLSPKFLAGESYGAFRSAALADALHERYGMFLNGIILVSGVLDFDTLWGSDLAYIGFLPTLCEVAAYHGKLSGDLASDREKRIAESEAFAKGPYAAALLAGSRLSGEQFDTITAELARFTGLSPEVIRRHRLRIDPGFFREELLRDEGKILGRFDARLIGSDLNLAGTYPDYDPSYEAVYGAFSATLKNYLRSDLGYESDLVYEILTRKVHPWNYGDQFKGRPIGVSDRLADVMVKNPFLKVMVNCGYHDLATPYFSIQHSLDHIPADPAYLDRIDYTFYEGGHMLYTIEESNKQWNQDVAEFIEANSE